jgi:hypothetical protein
MSTITHMSDARVTFEHASRQNPTVVAWSEACYERGGVTLDGYGRPLLSAHQCRKLAKWLTDRADQIEREHGNLRWLRGGARFNESQRRKVACE